MKHSCGKIKSLIYAAKMMVKYKKILFLLYSARTIIQLANAYIFIFFPSMLITNLQSASYFAAAMVVLGFVGLQMVISIISTIVQYRIEVAESEYDNQIDIIQYEKLMTLRYEQLVEPNVRNEYELSKACREKGSVKGIMSSIFSIINSIAVFFSAIVILRNLPLYVYVLITAFSLLRGISQMKVARKNYTAESEKAIAMRKLEYFRDGLTWRNYAKEIRAFSLSDFILRKLGENIDEVYHITQRYNHYITRKTWWAYVIGIPQDATIYIYNIFQVLKSKITLGHFSLNISALQQVAGSVDNILSQCISINEQLTYLNAFYAFLTLPSDNKGVNSLPQGEGVFEFIDVSFAYPGQTEYALKNLTLKIRLGEKISIVGQNGAGKTTFISLLMGLYKPSKGIITYNGVNIETIDYTDYISLFAPVMQNYHIFDFRIIDNLVFPTDEKITHDRLQAIQQVIDDLGLTKTINALSNGLETYITQTFSDEGVELSGGETQKLAFARCLCADAQVMILDEPTSSLSPQSEFEIYNRFGSISHSKTVLFISHRLASCSLSNRILVFDSGRLIEDGSHRDLIKRNGIYTNLYNSQIELFGLKISE